MTNLSPQAQAIIDAADEVFSNGGTIREGFAAALRALTEYSEMFYDPDEYADAVRVDDILKIVKELENV
jgi:hypothetical protein